MSERTDSEILKMKESRRSRSARIAETALEAIRHIENGSFEAVEEALADCQDGICELKQAINQDKKKRRARKHDSIAQTSPVG